MKRGEHRVGDLIVVLGPDDAALVGDAAIIALKYTTDPTQPSATAVFGDPLPPMLLQPAEIWQERANGDRVLVMRPLRMAKVEPGDY